jgi:hypothetical protein
MRKPRIKCQYWIASGIAYQWLIESRAVIESGGAPRKLTKLLDSGWQIDETWPDATISRIKKSAVASAMRALRGSNWVDVKNHFMVAQKTKTNQPASTTGAGANERENDDD